MSRARQPVSRAGFDQLLHQARRRNEADGITGLLASDGVSFLQAFEGPDHAIQACMGRIASDGRHGSISSLRETTIDVREFRSFSMVGLFPGISDPFRFVEQMKQAVEGVQSAQLQAMFIGYAVLGRARKPAE